ncbi:MAG: YkgJ family cysteine cluster protein [Pseudobdellovibrio sp.]
MHIHPCQKCGACCASFRASFHWSETLLESYGVPVLLTEPISLHQDAMIGTNQKNPHCSALRGIVGTSVECSIYLNRPSCCRSFKASFEDGFADLRCDDARISKGLPILAIEDWKHSLTDYS